MRTRPLLLICLLAASARAETPSVEGALLHYYGAEKRAAWVLGGLGVLSVGAGAVLVTQNSDLERGLGLPLLGLGALEALGGIFYILQVDAEIAHYEALLSSDRAGCKKPTGRGLLLIAQTSSSARGLSRETLRAGCDVWETSKKPPRRA